MKNVFSKILFFVALCSMYSLVHADEEEDKQAKLEEIVALARSCLGDEDALDAVKTLKFEGVLVYGNGDSGTFNSVYKKPLFQQFNSVINNVKETSTLNRSEAWRRVENVAQPGSFSLEFHNIADMYHMQASVRGALGFLSKPNSRTGRIEYVRTVESEGEVVHILNYIHADGIWFRHYIDGKTGKVVSTLNDKGVVFEEVGEQIVDGIKFPERLVTRSGDQVLELSYTSVKVNEEVDNSIFSVPVMSN